MKEQLRMMFGRALSVNKDLKKGHIIAFDDLEVKKPANAGINVAKYKNILGKVLRKPKSKWDFLNFDNFLVY